ncbi:hypothetical protein J2X36_002168 [Methylobacterium sp. BE186]|uniref:hypothetical protein n=1 Tax=Methylobacterium sp. BE186 TaxID=2817715 RepID=UPI00285F977C|nr:hypothetical protein [Methylobacterium sp. BE186]MDR7037421.1 hypothetical protein [Methylobacterium sp. BE186]
MEPRMSCVHPLDWQAALRDLKADRSALPEVREERLRTSSVHRGPFVLQLSAWRGRSGRRYVVGVHSLKTLRVDDFDSCVAVAVRRNGDMIAEVEFVAEVSCEMVATGFMAVARRAGITEVHIHRLAGSFAEREAIAADLAPLMVKAA